jgi:outer membrane biosynthesis protein TonB
MSLVLHASVVAAAIIISRESVVALPPVYKVDLVAAPAGPRAIGSVSEAPAKPPTETPAPVPKRAETPNEMPVPTKKPVPARKPVAPATKVPNAKAAPRDAPAPKAGGGTTGGTGTDVANVHTEGLNFPFPEYLHNIVNQIALRFKPRNPGALSAEVSFLIRRDGSVTAFAFRRRSGVYVFDLEAQGAVEAAGRSGSFGPLPDGFKDDALPVSFSFDPQLIR